MSTEEQTLQSGFDKPAKTLPEEKEDFLGNLAGRSYIEQVIANRTREAQLSKIAEPEREKTVIPDVGTIEQYGDYDNQDLIRTSNASYLKELNKFNAIYER